jgi:hypothetical protein
MPIITPFTSTSTTSWMNSTTVSDTATTMKSAANSTWTWLYENVLFDKLDRIVYQTLMTSANWTTSQLKALDLEARANDIDWVLVGSMLTFFFVTLWVLNRMTPTKPPTITVSLNLDSLDEIDLMDGFTKPRRSARIAERAMRALDADILAAIGDKNISARDIRMILLPSYPTLTVADINSRLYTLLFDGTVAKYRATKPTWVLA